MSRRYIDTLHHAEGVGHTTVRGRSMCRFSGGGLLTGPLLDTYAGTGARCAPQRFFYTLREAKVLIERWRQYYNRQRPHSSLGYRPPAPEAITAVPPASATSSRQNCTLEMRLD